MLNRQCGLTLARPTAAPTVTSPLTPACFVLTLHFLLQLLAFLHRHTGPQARARAGLGPDAQQVRVTWVCAALQRKLERQLSEPRAILWEALPDWCESLCRGARFLFDLEPRRVLLRDFTYGPSRAVHRLQTRGATGSGFDEVGALEEDVQARPALYRPLPL